MEKGDSAAVAAVMLTSGASGRVNALFSMRVLNSLLILINAIVMLFLLPFRGRKRSVSTAALLQDDKQDQRKLPPVLLRVPPNVPWKSSSVVDQDVAARRALAIRRVMQANHENSLREFSLFVTSRGETMFTQSWTLVSKQIRGLVVVLHGLNEHGDRYGEFAKELNANGFKVYAMDWTGHGGSDGLHAYVHSLDEAVVDTKSFIGKVVAENPGLPCFCFGHSTGGAIILKAVLDPNIEACIAGVVLTSPAVGVQPSHPIFTVLAPVFSWLFPRLQLRAANKQGMVVCRDPEALVAKYSDPLVYTGSIRIRTGYEILRITTYLQQNLKRLKVPFLVLHGTTDTITDPEASKKLYEEASSTDKTIKLLQGCLHDLLFEPEREMIVETIIDWLNCRVY
ncbi:Monoacylglycerol lipase [Camellia lanceoleosa]|uniref:Monoacylglycerol lipase n=1 Tax=Camellia lanceoleosa TaxID=1840588 RepID=A0ACC0FEQ7_9ERIC|nr:Monoacylglycerol lipase [Camellia lanceoleosa]